MGNSDYTQSLNLGYDAGSCCRDVNCHQAKSWYVMLYPCGHLAERQVFKEIVAQYFDADNLCLNFQLNVPKYGNTCIILSVKCF